METSRKLYKPSLAWSDTLYVGREAPISKEISLATRDYFIHDYLNYYTVPKYQQNPVNNVAASN